jgi:hypothetical protein
MVNRNINIKTERPIISHEDLRQGARYMTNLACGVIMAVISLAITALSVWIFALYGLNLQNIPDLMVGLGLAFSITYILIVLFSKRLRNIFAVQCSSWIVLCNLIFYVYLIAK